MMRQKMSRLLNVMNGVDILATQTNVGANQLRKSRLEEESKELDAKLVKLTAFHNSEPFFKLKVDDQNDLQEQLYCMSQYSGILRKRLAKAKGYYTGYISTQNGCVSNNSQQLIEPAE